MEREIRKAMRSVFWSYSRLVGVWGVGLALAVLVWDLFSSLQARHWSSLSILDILVYLGIRPPTTEWVLGQVAITLVLLVSLSLLIFICAVLGATILAIIARNADRNHRAR